MFNALKTLGLFVILTLITLLIFGFMRDIRPKPTLTTITVTPEDAAP